MSCYQMLEEFEYPKEVIPEVVEGGAHWEPKGKFSVELMRIFVAASK